MAPRRRASQMVGASVSVQPVVTAGITTSGLNTAKAAATTSPETCPMSEPRLVKYETISGIVTPFMRPGDGWKPRAT